MLQRKWLVLGALGALLLAPACSKDSKAGDSDEKGETTKAAPGAAKASPEKAAPAAKPGAKPGAKTDLAGKKYGEGITQSESVAISDLLAEPDKYAGKRVRVEGTVSDVCPKRGCWFEMAGEKPGEKMRFKVRDGVMTFALDEKGKYAVAEGLVHTRKLTLEETREYLEYQAKEYGKDVDPASVTEPMTVVRLDGKGALIRDSK